ncbi:hypothetical protein GALL_95350 [mine drainage metagenome]|uniref:Uncharacterized protein n=1 Tax=mine drainage metagenome TaxID=410659 RepID=A0A1J5SIY1_9ZZZZ
MYKYVLLPIIFVISFTQCTNKKNNAAVNTPAADTTVFFPVNDFIKNDIKDVQQNPYHIYKITSHKPGKRDSVTISVDDFILLADLFLKKDITMQPLKSIFKESVFHDLTTKSITLLYATTDSASDIKNVTVLLDDKNNKPKRIFIRSYFNKGDYFLNEQLNWKIGKSFQIIRSIFGNNRKNSEEETTIIWNDKSY